jgi:hypothetical protein
MMTIEVFETTLRALMRREPFEPFTVELLDGERFVVDRPDAVGFNAGAAGFIGPDGAIHFFNNEEVRSLGGGRNGPAA